MKYDEINLNKGRWFIPTNRSGPVYYQYHDKKQMTTPYTVNLNINNKNKSINVWLSNSEACLKETGIYVKYPCIITVQREYQGEIIYSEKRDDYLSCKQAIIEIKKTSFKLEEKDYVKVETHSGSTMERYYEKDKM